MPRKPKNFGSQSSSGGHKARAKLKEAVGKLSLAVDKVIQQRLFVLLKAHSQSYLLGIVSILFLEGMILLSEAQQFHTT